MKAKLAAIGEKDIMLIFKAIGIDVFSVDTAEEAASKIRNLAKQDYAIIFITEIIAAKLDYLIREYTDRFLPSIVVIPGLKERNKYAVKRLRQAIVKAVGADVFGSEAVRTD